MPLRRKILGAVAAAVVALTALAWWAITWEPPFYHSASQLPPDSDSVRKLSKTMTQRVMQFADEVRNEPTFEADFTEEQVNAWLADELERKHSQLLPKELGRPRVHFSDRQFEIACQYRHDVVTTVASGTVKAWVTDDHLLALEVDTLRDGRIPLPIASILEPLVRQLRSQNRRAEWRQIDGHEVLVVDLLEIDDGSQSDDKVDRVLETVELKPGVIRLKGRQVARKNRSQ
ncbi:MAG: hypothetical protein NT069_15105 [Planctomycetota bacterium]|nr:hypothetical protein [Planctomycetota bacterium]